MADSSAGRRAEGDLGRSGGDKGAPEPENKTQNEPDRLSGIGNGTPAPRSGTENQGGSRAADSHLQLTADHLAEMIAHCLRCVPEEGCGLLVGRSDGVVVSVEPARNAAASSQLYTIDPRDHLRIDREAEDAGLEVIGVFHSHTHTDPWPSPTDVRQAPDPSWHYVLVGLRLEVASTRSYRIVDGKISEEAVVVLDGYNLT